MVFYQCCKLTAFNEYKSVNDFSVHPTCKLKTCYVTIQRAKTIYSEYKRPLISPNPKYEGSDLYLINDDEVDGRHKF
jgi:hypothetical protein